MKHLLARIRLATFALGLLVACGVFAHNKLLSTAPADQGTLQQSPASVDLSFNDATYLESVVLLDADGQPVALDFTVPAELSAQFSIPVPALAPGRYTVKWAVEGSDTHKLSGEFSFSVEAGDAQ